MAELQCRGLEKSYGDRVVLAGVDLVVPQGTLTAVLGASGSGKTTLLRLLIGFVAADRGVVSIGGNVVADGQRVHVPPDKRAVGYVAQEGALFPHLSVAENVGFGLPRSERRRGARIGDALDLVGLDPRGGPVRRSRGARPCAPTAPNRPGHGLPGPRRGRPSFGLSRARRMAMVRRPFGPTGREVAVLRDGRLVQTAAPDALYRTPADLDVARFVGEAVVVPGEARAGTVVCILGTLRVRGEAVEGPVQVMIRPEQIQVGRVAAGSGVVARVVGQSFYGAETVLRLQLADGSDTVVTARTFDGGGAEPGDEVSLVVEGPVAVYRPEAVTR